MTVARVAVMKEPGQPLELCDVPLPNLQSEEILIEVIACTLCGSDLHSLHGRRVVPMPSVLGHEILGRIVAIGSETNRNDAAGQPIELGDRVTWSIIAHCNDCFYCRRDLPQKCLHQLKYGHETFRAGRELTGGLASHCLLAKGTTIFRVPDELSDAAACPANCATATIAAAIKAAGRIADRNVLVLGAGMLGVTAAAWAHALRASSVIACDTSAARLELAKDFGADRVSSVDDLPMVVSEATGGHGVDVLLELTGSPDAFEAALPHVRMGGTAIVVGAVFPGRPVPIALEQLVRRCLTLRGIHNYAPRHLQAALEFLVNNRKLPFDSLVSPWQALDNINAALATSPSPPALRIGIVPA